MRASTLQLCSRLTLLLALSHAAVIRPAEDHVLLDPEDLCPCIQKEVCPRVWGTLPEDSLLGNFSACREQGFVRCCGIKEHDSGESLTESSEELSSAGDSLKSQSERVIPHGIVVPVPFLFPKYVDYGTSTISEPTEIVPAVENSGEVEGSEESGEWVDELFDEIEPTLASDQVGGSPPVLKPGLIEAGGKNIDNKVSQADNFVSFNSLDYRGVDKHLVTEGGAEATTGGETSSGNKRDEETSNYEKMDEIFVGGETGEPSIVQFPDTKEAQVDANGENEPSELSTVRKLGTIQSSITSSKSSEASVSQRDKDTLEALEVSSEIDEPVTSQTAESQFADSGSKNRGKTVFREENSTQKKSEEVTNKESSNYNEKISSFTIVYDDDDDGSDRSYGIAEGIKLKPLVTASELEETTESEGKLLNRGRTEVLTQEESESAVKESSKIEENSSSNVQSTILENREESSELSDEIESNPIREVEKPTSSTRPAIGGQGFEDRPSRGQRTEITSEQKTETTKEESSNFEESKSSKVENVITDIVGQSDENVNFKILDTSASRASNVGQSNTNKLLAYRSRGKSSRGQRQETKSEQKTETAEKESSNFEESKISTVEKVIMDIADQSGEDVNSEILDTRKSQAPKLRQLNSYRRPSYGSRSQSNRGQRLRTTIERKSESSEKESSSTIEESRASKIENVITNTAGQSGEVENSEILDTRASQALNARKLNSYRRPTFGLRSQLSRGQRQETTIEQKSESSKKESSSTTEESKTSSIKNSATDIRNKLDESPGAGSIATFSQKIEKDKKESSSSEKSSSSNIETSKTEELSTNGGNFEIVLEEEKKETSISNAEKSESTKEESSTSSVQEEIFSTLKESASEDKVAEVQTTPSKIPVIETAEKRDSNKETVDPPQKKPLTVSMGLPSSETFTPTSSNLMNILSGKLPHNSGASSKPDDNDNSDKIPPQVNENTSGMDKVHHFGVWHVANRTYIPVLINAGYLKDRPTSTGSVGLDPLSGVTHSDIANSEVAPELLPLSCGNVIFGERFRDGKTLVCEIPRSNEVPIRFFKEEVSPVSQEKLRRPPLLGAILPVGILTPSDGVESLKLTTVTTGQNRSRKPMRKRIVIKRPVPTAAKQEILEKEVPAWKPAQNLVDRGLIRHDSGTQKRFEGNVKEENDRVVESPVEIGSKETAKESSSLLASSSWKSMSSQESVSTPDIPTETTKAEFEVTSEELLKADREAVAMNSKFYVLPLASVLPPRPKGSRSLGAENFMTTAPASLAASESAKIIEVVGEAPSKLTRIGRRRQRIISGKKLPSSDLQVATVNSDEDSKSSTGFYNRNTRQVTRFPPNNLHPERKVISADEISPSGRVNIVGPIPPGFYDRTAERNQALIELPNQKSSLNNVWLPDSVQKQEWN